MRRIVPAVVVTLALVTGCSDEGARPIFGTTAPTTTSASTSTTPPPPTTTTTSAPTTTSTTTTVAPSTTLIESRLSVEACKLYEVAGMGNIGLGFPRYVDRMRSTGTVRGIVLFADFEDVPATRTTQEMFAIVSPVTEDFFSAVSYGQMDLELVPHHEWLRLSQPASVYADAITSFVPHRDHVQEAMTLADPNVDFTGADLVVVLNTPNASDITFGPTYTGYPGGGEVEADGQVVLNGVTSGVDILYWGGMWLPHEMGHTLGLVDLYSHDGLPGYTGEFGIMNDIAAQAPEFFAYERWLVGWLDDDQIACVGGHSTAFLSAIETSSGLKAVSVPVTGSKSVMVESRRPIGYDSGLARPGAVVYVVDTSISSGHGTLEVMNSKLALGAGESVTVEGVTVTVLDARDDGDLVAIEVDS